MEDYDNVDYDYFNEWDLEQCKEEIKRLKRQIRIKDSYMHLIYAIGFDYDGYNDVKNLKDIIDELVDYSKKAVRCDDKWVAYEDGNDKKLNILMEEIEDK